MKRIVRLGTGYREGQSGGRCFPDVRSVLQRGWTIS
jgi:hypothetical protein